MKKDKFIVKRRILVWKQLNVPETVSIGTVILAVVSISVMKVKIVARQVVFVLSHVRRVRCGTARPVGVLTLRR